jgi:hypothetical protein
MLRFKNTVLKLEEKIGQYTCKHDDFYRSFLDITQDLNGSYGFVSALVKTIHECGYSLSTSWYEMFPPSDHSPYNNSNKVPFNEETDHSDYTGEDNNDVDRDWTTIVASGVVTNAACFKPTNAEEK